MENRTCSKCGTVCGPQARFCFRCRNPLTGGGQEKLTCEKGHRLDPSWTECPFCKSSQAPPVPPLPIAEMPAPAVPRQQTLVQSPDQIKKIVFDGRKSPKKKKKDKDKYITLIAPTANTPSLPEQRAQAQGQPVPPNEAVPQVRSVVMGQTPQPGGMPQGPIVGALATFSHVRNGSAYLIRTGRHVIGSSGTANIKVKDSQVAAKHAVLYAKPGMVVLEDCTSPNGTYVNGKPISEKVKLASGDVVQTGDTLWRFVLIETPDPALLRK